MVLIQESRHDSLTSRLTLEQLESWAKAATTATASSPPQDAPATATTSHIATADPVMATEQEEAETVDVHALEDDGSGLPDDFLRVSKQLPRYTNPNKQAARRMFGMIMLFT